LPRCNILSNLAFTEKIEKKMKKIGIIGGSGLNNPDILTNTAHLNIQTAYGAPSSPIKKGKMGKHEVYIIARHGQAHQIPPTQVNNRANIQAFKDLGIDYIIATTAVGSLKEEIQRGDLVIIDQFIDFTRHRAISFFDSFEDGEMKHTPMSEPFNAFLREKLIKQCNIAGIRFHKLGTVITIEGPRFSTKAESHMFRNWGADIINMSVAPECILANEAQIPYAAVAMSTDYDSWKENETPVSWEEVLKVFNENVQKVTQLLINTIKEID
jgi:5'-methylthioadenosine phosphorylase